MTRQRTSTGGGHEIALCAALPLEAPAEGAPEWLHLLPLGELRTNDSRGPYTVGDIDALMAESMKDGKIVLDENHSTDLAAPKGLPAPARGWIVELQQRQDGVWGRVEWTEDGRAKVEAREYRGISPVIAHTKAKVVKAIRRASLVNKPNLEGLVALHQENEDMDLREQLIEALNLAQDADDAAILAAVKSTAGATETAIQAALAPIADKLGVAADGDLAGAIESLQAARPAGDEVIEALQAELRDVGEQLVALQQAGSEDKAVAFVDAAIAAGTVGVKPMRDEYIAMHMADPAKTEKLVGALPAVGGKVQAPSGQPKRSADLDAHDKRVIALMGVDPEEFKKVRAQELGLEEEAL